jgi:hypothetical protein
MKNTSSLASCDGKRFSNGQAGGFISGEGDRRKETEDGPKKR